MLKHHLKLFFNNSLWSFGDQTVALIIGFIVSPLISRLLPPESRGVFILVFLVPGMISSFVVLGIPPSNVFFYASKKIDSLTVDKVNFYLGSIMALAGVIINLIVAYSLKNTFYSEVPFTYILLSTSTIPLNIFITFMMSTLMAKQLFKKTAIFLSSMNILNFALTIGIFIYFKNALFLLVILTIAILVIKFFTLILITKPQFIHNKSSINSYLKIAIGYGLPAHLSNIVTYFNYRADQYLVSFILGNSALGLYSVAVGLSEKLWVFSTTLSSVAFPKLAELLKDSFLQDRISLFLARWVFIGSVFGAFIMAIFAPFYIRYAHGLNYIDSIPLFMIMLPGVIMWGAGRIFANAIAAKGITKPILYIAISTFSINFLLNLILLPNIGVKGASIATVIAYFTDTLLKVYYYCRITNQKVSDLFKFIPEEKAFLKFQIYRFKSKKLQ